MLRSLQIIIWVLHIFLTLSTFKCIPTKKYNSLDKVTRNSNVKMTEVPEPWRLCTGRSLPGVLDRSLNEQARRMPPLTSASTTTPTHATQQTKLTTHNTNQLNTQNQNLLKSYNKAQMINRNLNQTNKHLLFIRRGKWLNLT